VINYTVTTSSNPPNGGTTTGGDIYPCGNNINVTATASDGYQFDNWSENGIILTTQPSYYFTIFDNHVLVANFSEGVGVNQYFQSDCIKIFPIPFHDKLTLELNDLSEKAIIIISDINGKIIKTDEIQNAMQTKKHEIFLNIKPGVYVISIKNKNFVINRKIICI
jgi:hypothetical protein